MLKDAYLRNPARGAGKVCTSGDNARRDPQLDDLSAGHDRCDLEVANGCCCEGSHDQHVEVEVLVVLPPATHAVALLGFREPQKTRYCSIPPFDLLQNMRPLDIATLYF